MSSSKAFGKIALDATLRAICAATKEPAGRARDPRNAAPVTWNPIPPDALRFKLFKRKQGRLFIFAIDLSGSMALKRITHAREVMLDLLRQSYIHRDSVAIVGFHGRTAELMLPPSRSILRARRVLDTLPLGGGTPLAAGLARALELAKRVGPSVGEIALLVFTDGGANVSLHANEQDSRALRQQIIESEIARLGEELKKTGLTIVLFDTQKDFRDGDETRKIAETLGARFVRL